MRIRFLTGKHVLIALCALLGSSASIWAQYTTDDPAITPMFHHDVITINPSPTPSPVPSSTPSPWPYAAGQQLGNIMTLPNTGNGLVQSLVVVDSDSQNIALDFMFFSASPTLTSTNHAAFGTSTPGLILGTVHVGTSDYSTIGSKGMVSLKNIGLNIKADSGLTLYVVAIAQGTANYTKAPTVRIGIQH